MSGKGTNQLRNEAGCHRIQRVSPTEKRGRVHTSSVTVAVLDLSIKTNTLYDLIDDAHFRYEYYKSSGPGGQHRNKVTSAVRCIHIPTGLKQERTSKCQHTNKKNAKEGLIQLLQDESNNHHQSVTNTSRQVMIGSGLRGDKKRTYRFQDDVVIDHITGKRGSCKLMMKGNLDKLWI